MKNDIIKDGSVNFSRHKKTLMALVISTLISSVLAFFAPVFILSILVIPLIFGIALIQSNIGYLKYKYSNLIICVSFIIIFYRGMSPFYWFAHLITDNLFVLGSAGTIGGFFLIILTVKLNLKETTIGYFQILLTIILAILSHTIFFSLIGGGINRPNIYLFGRLYVIIFVYQVFISLNILAILKPGKPAEINPV